MTVIELEKLLAKLIAEGKGEYIVSYDGYRELDAEVVDGKKELRLW